MAKQGYYIEIWNNNKRVRKGTVYGLPIARMVSYRALKYDTDWKGEARLYLEEGKQPFGIIKDSRFWPDDPINCVFIPHGAPMWKPTHKVRADGSVVPKKYISMADVRKDIELAEQRYR